jgi:DNA-binding transcriptional LysR family regulator
VWIPNGRIAALEKALGARLVEREPAGLVLTDAGRAAIAAAEQVDTTRVALRDSLSNAGDAQPRGAVRLTAPQWLASRFIIPALSELKARHPQLDVQLVGTNQILNLAQREADIAIRNVRPAHKSLVSRKIIKLRRLRLRLEAVSRTSRPTAFAGCARGA